MKNSNILKSILCALRGLFLALREEKNFRFYFLNILFTLPLNFIFHFSVSEHLIYMICVVGVFASECVNTAIERLCDHLTIDYDVNIRTVKDVAAGAVLCWGLGFYIVEAILLGGKLIG